MARDLGVATELAPKGRDLGQATFEQSKADLAHSQAAVQRVAPPSPYGAVGDALGNFSEGVAKGEVSTLKGLGTIGQTIANQTVGRVSNLIAGKGFTPTTGGLNLNATTQQQAQAPDVLTAGSAPAQAAGEFLKPTGTAQTLGFGAEKVGETLLPTPTKGGILANAAQFGGISAAQGGIGTLAEGGDYKEAAKNSFTAGLTGAALGGAGKILSNTLSKVAEKAPESLYNNALKVLNKIKGAGKSPANFLKDEGTWGNLGAFEKAATEGMGAENSIIKQAAFNTPGGTTYDDVLQKAADSLKSKLGDLYSPEEVQGLLQNVPVARLRDAKGPINWVDLDGVRSALGSLIGDSKWLSSTPSQQTQAAEAMYTALSDTLKKATGTEEAFKRLSQWIGTSKVTKRAIDMADSRYGLGLADTISGTTGAILGGVTGEGDVGTRLKNAAIGGATGVAIERGINSPAMKTGIAQLIEHISSLPTDTAGKISKGAILQLLNTITGANQSDQPQDQP